MLRPLNTIEVLDAAWLAVRRAWPQLYAASSVGTLPLALLVVGYFRWLGTVVAGTEPGQFYGGTMLWGGLMAAAWALNSLARAAATLIVLGEARGETVTLAAAWRASLRQAGSCAFVGLAAFAALWAAASCFLVGGVFLASAWWVTRPVVMDEDCAYTAAFRRSWNLTSGYRSRAFSLWLVFLLLWALGLYNIHLLARFLLGMGGEFLGTDTTGLQQFLQFRNQGYTTFLLVVLFVLLDPLKSAADAMLYLDLRIRGEGADLQGRLRALRAGAAVLALLLLPSNAHAMTLEQYRDRVRALRSEVERAPAPEGVDRLRVAELRSQLVEMPGGQKITVENDWLRSGLTAWGEEPKSKEALLHRLEALERSLGGVPPPTLAPANPEFPARDRLAQVDARETVREILQEPEFQPLAARPEFQELMKRVDLRKTGSWWQSFIDWVKKVFFKPPPPPRVEPPRVQAPDLTVPLYIVLGLALLFVLALLVKWFVERPVRDDARPAALAGEAPPLEASATENALDHTVDEWEQFARAWLDRGDLRQAIRALYLATLVHLHRERRIEYNRAFTNWVYVRSFRGEAEQKGTLRRLTQTFDEVWYGDRAPSEEQFRAFEQGARALGTPAPTVGPAHA